MTQQIAFQKARFCQNTNPGLAYLNPGLQAPWLSEPELAQSSFLK